MDQKRIYLSAGIAAFIVLIIYIWFISIGPWRIRGYTSDYYSQMASAFQHGQLALEAKPAPALLALPNPYDPKARKNIPLLGDASLYKGKYYLYFGPLPSLPLALIADIFPIHAGDQIFVYVFLVGLFFLQSLFFITLFRQYFSSLPFWIVPSGILLLGVAGPYTRMLAHPFIHEAAISGGQVFSTAGLYFAFLALQNKPINNRKLFIASVFWACSLATRITQLLPISALVVVTLLFIMNEHRKAKLSWNFASSTLALTAPLLFTGLLLGWYNWARFDSISEFGLYYQLAAFNLQANYSALFSRVYVVQNIYNYFLNPFELRGSFPFVFPLPGSEKSILAAHELPRLYAVEGKFPGLLISTPLLIFSVLPLLLLTIKFIRSFGDTEIRSDLYNHFDWTVVSLSASFVAGSIPTLLLFYVGFRYETEFVSSLMLLGMIGFCQGYMLFRNAMVRKFYTVIGASLMVFSCAVNIALALSGIRG